MGFNQRRMARERAAAMQAEEERRQRELGPDVVQAQKLVAVWNSRAARKSRPSFYPTPIREYGTPARLVGVSSGRQQQTYRWRISKRYAWPALPAPPIQRLPRSVARAVADKCKSFANGGLGQHHWQDSDEPIRCRTSSGN